MRHTRRCANVAAFYAFVDGNFLNNKRPPIPGGSWPLESLRGKSMADLQQLWFALVRERNMLATMREHYLRHQEELGALPAPSRLTLVEESMQNIKHVVKERDAAATAAAVKTFEERLKRGVYRYPPGPPAPPGAHHTGSVVRLVLSKRVEPDRLRELLGRYDEFAEHRGIVRLELVLPEEVQAQKKAAEEAWQAYRGLCSDVREYYKWHDQGPSVYDAMEVELAPNVYLTADPGASGGEMGEGQQEEGEHGGREGQQQQQQGQGQQSAAAAGVEEGEEMHREETGQPTRPVTSLSIAPAAELPVPAPQSALAPPQHPLDRIRYERASVFHKMSIQLPYFPGTTQAVPAYRRVQDIPRPTHPDEIEGPWHVYITYDRPDGAAYVRSLELHTIDGAAVMQMDDVTAATTGEEGAHSIANEPAAAVDPVYQEALRRERAQEETMMRWPHVPMWKTNYQIYTRKHVADIVQHNYSNVVDYVDREVLLTGKSVWELPIKVDVTCGGIHSIPAGATPPKAYMQPSIDDAGVTDL